ncbi:ribonuclease H-like domain-containing protein [Tanacetum coccineum]
MCDKKNSVLFTDTECVVLSPDFKLLDENHATLDESNLWHRRLEHINFKTMNKLVRGNLVRGLPSKIFENNHTCVLVRKESNIKPLVRPRLILVIKPNKTPYELFLGGKPALSFMRPFGCPVTILNTINHLVVAGNQSNGSAGTKACYDARKARMEIVPGKNYILLPFLTQDLSFSSSLKDSPDAGFKPSGEEEKKDAKDAENKDS